MTRSAFQRVAAGDPLTILDSEYNAFIRTATADGRGERGEYRRAQTVQVFNDSGATIPGDQIRKLGDISFEPKSDNFYFAADNLATTDRGFVYIPRPIRNQTYGRGIIGGVFKAVVNVGHESHDRADVHVSTIQLESGFAGHAKILYKPAATGVQTCVLWLDQLDQGEVKGTCDADIAIDGAGDVSVFKNGSDTNDNITAHLNWMHGGEGISSGKQVLCRWFSDEKRWVIVGADCE